MRPVIITIEALSNIPVEEIRQAYKQLDVVGLVDFLDPGKDGEFDFDLRQVKVQVVQGPSKVVAGSGLTGSPHR